MAVLGAVERQGLDAERGPEHAGDRRDGEGQPDRRGDDDEGEEAMTAQHVLRLPRATGARIGRSP